MEKLKIGVITDLEGNTKKLTKILPKFRKEKIELLVLGGDIPSKRKNSLTTILKKCLKLKISTIIIPGSHESFEDYSKQVNKIKNKLLIEGIKKPKFKIKGYDFVFAPGSDALSEGAQYPLLKSKRQLSKHKRWRKEYITHFKTTKVKPSYITEIRKQIKNKNTIIISHIPPYFRKKESIDVANSGKVLKKFQIKPEHRKLKFIKEAMENLEVKDFERTHILIFDFAKRLIKLGYPIKVWKRNVGNKHLKKLIKEKKIKKLICGHIHESGRKACNLKGQPIKSNKFSKELFLNSGEASKGYASIVILKGELAKYKKIRV